MKTFLVSIPLFVIVGLLLTAAPAQASFGIDPGKIYIDNLYPGAQADALITVYNQNDYETTFNVSTRKPDSTGEGYESFPHMGWVTISPARVTVAAGGESEVLVTITMPDDADYSGKKAELWISFREEGTTGMVKIELASRLLISTRTEAAETPPVVTPGSGTLGIVAEAKKPESVSGFSPWAILGSLLGVLFVAGSVFFLVKRKLYA